VAAAAAVRREHDAGTRDSNAKAYRNRRGQR
jgi:hypothetical protein